MERGVKRTEEGIAAVGWEAALDGMHIDIVESYSKRQRR